jgi:pimeloyl-ACP methyl ester carboxylesterase
MVGDGPVILISHGTLGGYDQGLAVAQLFDQEKFSFLAVSRAGYLRSTPDTGRTPEEQAHSYAELLNHLSIKPAALIGLSGGAPSAIAFSELYPERCWALVLISSITPTPALPPIFKLAVRSQDLMMRFDRFLALVYRYGLGALMRSNGVSRTQSDLIMSDPGLLSIVRGIFQPIKTSSLRRPGVRLDDIQINSLPAERKLTGQVPTYITHAANDPLAPPSAAAHLAEGNPGIEYHAYQDGGHLFFVVHNQVVIPDIQRFLLENAPA